MEWLQHRDRSRLALAGLGLGVVLFFAVNVFSNATFQGVQLDLTEGKLFTLSKGTRKVLASLDEPITFQLYFTKLLGERSPGHAVYFERVREFLRRYADLSGGKVRLRVRNPEPFSDAEDQAIASGLQGVPVNNAGDLGYFGLAGANSIDDRTVIPFFTTEREAFLEYDLTKMIHTLANPDGKVVGLMSSLPINGGGMKPPFTPTPRWAVMDQVNEFFQVLPLPTQLSEIPENVDILMVVHPIGMDDSTLYAIDQFVLRGGRALVFVDANAEAAANIGGGGGEPGKSQFNKILGAWGLKLAADKVAGDLDAARRVNVRVGKKVAVADYVTWMSLTPLNFDTGDAVIGNISLINVASPGILENTGAPGVTVTPLITTGPRAMSIDAAKVGARPDVVGLFRDYKPGNKRLTLAARVKGTIKSAFPDGPPKDEEKTGQEATGGEETASAAKHLSESRKPVNIIVVADADMLHDQFWVTVRNLLGQRLLVPFANNADFVVNALDNLSGSDALIGLRGRAESTRPFKMVQDIRRDAERRFRAKEQDLQAKLQDLRANLERLERHPGAEGDIIISADDKAAIDDFRIGMAVVRKELRGVQRALRKDIDRLDAWLKFLNIAAIPLLLGVGAVVVSVVRRARRKTWARAA